MRLTADDATARLAAADHGVLCTVHAVRGVDAVPCVYAFADGHVAIPVDRVKPKATTRLQRTTNLEADPRAALLVERWDRDDWSKLWWVRAELRLEGGDAERSAGLAARLAASFVQYRDHPFSSLLVLRLVGITGWAAT